MAFRFANLPSSEVGILSRIAFPVYSKLQDDLPKLKNAYLKMVKLFAFLAIPLAGGIFLLAPQLTQIFLGNKWMPIVPALKILAISSLIREIIGTSGALFNAKGRPDIDFKINLIRVITLAITIYPLTMMWKITGTSLAVLLAICACLPMFLFEVTKLSDLKINDYTKVFLPPFFATFVMSVIIFIFGKFLNQFQLIGFFISVFFGIITFLGCIFLFHKWTDYSIFKDLIFIFKSLKSKQQNHESKTC
jgi:O-antigen/teichoic acid export membrane protein